MLISMRTIEALEARADPKYPREVWMCDPALTLREMADKYGMPIPRSRAEELETRPYANALECLRREYLPRGAAKPADPGPDPSRCYLVGKYIHEHSNDMHVFHSNRFCAYEFFRTRFTKVVKNPDESPGADLFVMVRASRGMPKRRLGDYATVDAPAETPPPIPPRERFVLPSRADRGFAEAVAGWIAKLAGPFSRDDVRARARARKAALRDELFRDTRPSAPPAPPEPATAQAARPPKQGPRAAWGPEVTCPITLEAVVDPVLAEDGHVYERNAIEAWFAKGRKTSPVTNEPLASARVTPVYALRR